MDSGTAVNFWQNRRVLVTGAGGFLGGWLVRGLLNHGAEVIALLRTCKPDSQLVRDGTISRVIAVTGSVEDYDLIRRTLSNHSVDTVMHLAAQPLAGAAKTNPLATFQANIAGTWNILEASRQTGVRQVLLASSEKAYGDSGQIPYTEDLALQGTAPYDCSKSCGDLIAATYWRTYGLPVSMVRCANLFGGGDLNWSRIIPGVIKATLEGRRFVIRSDGRNVRDFLYVRDAAAAYLSVCESLAAGAPQGPYNFCVEARQATLDCAYQVLSLMGRQDLEPEILNEPNPEVREQYMSAAKARELLGWKPSYGMPEALDETISWYRNYFAKREDAGSGSAAA